MVIEGYTRVGILNTIYTRFPYVVESPIFFENLTKLKCS